MYLCWFWPVLFDVWYHLCSVRHWQGRLSHLVVFNLTFFDILVLLVSKWKFHHSSSNMVTKYDLIDADFNTFWQIQLAVCITLTNCLCFNNLSSNHVSWSYLKMNGKIFILIRAILNIGKEKIENDQVWKSS